MKCYVFWKNYAFANMNGTYIVLDFGKLLFSKRRFAKKITLLLKLDEGMENSVRPSAPTFALKSSKHGKGSATTKY